MSLAPDFDKISAVPAPNPARGPARRTESAAAAPNHGSTSAFAKLLKGHAQPGNAWSADDTASTGLGARSGKAQDEEAASAEGQDRLGTAMPAGSTPPPAPAPSADETPLSTLQMAQAAQLAQQTEQAEQATAGEAAGLGLLGQAKDAGRGHGGRHAGRAEAAGRLDAAAVADAAATADAAQRGAAAFDQALQAANEAAAGAEAAAGSGGRAAQPVVDQALTASDGSLPSLGAMAAPGAAAATAPSPAPEAARPTASAELPVPPGSPAFPAAVGVQLSTWLRDGVEHASLELHPRELGPIEVRIAVRDGATQIDLGADVASTRAALAEALPQLAQQLGEVGLNLSGGSVSDQTGERARQSADAQAQADDRRAAALGRGAGTGRDAGRGGDLLGGLGAARPAAQTRGLLDLYA